ncbi:hypothetical protein K458DRAFT_392601 [Lentithecium fluviatile CBS 122367]|uniref:Uncharacterized protein n=1 Tax=Lentithecium fluviatile CBS 122367 TaxID=1168545 RepID=A0A6G1ISM5_9PLEO|nr:hypothetical protein K458DRAFT_392601 [Lentithecium fluviatile CBS 122367]
MGARATKHMQVQLIWFAMNALSTSEAVLTDETKEAVISRNKHPRPQMKVRTHKTRLALNPQIKEATWKGRDKREVIRISEDDEIEEERQARSDEGWTVAWTGDGLDPDEYLAYGSERRWIDEYNELYNRSM